MPRVSWSSCPPPRQVHVPLLYPNSFFNPLSFFYGIPFRVFIYTTPASYLNIISQVIFFLFDGKISYFSPSPPFPLLFFFYFPTPTGEGFNGKCSHWIYLKSFLIVDDQNAAVIHLDRVVK